MNDQVKMSVDGRRNAVYNAYELSEEQKAKVEALFVKIEELGADCKDAMDFEQKFAASPLNQEYINLFTELATSSKSKLGPVPDAEIEEGPTAGEVVADLAKNDAEMAIDGAVQAVRGRAVRAAYDKARDIPGVGAAMSAQQGIGFFRSLKK